MLCDFQTTTHGKWILVGEHAVIRGHGALVFPLSEKSLTLNYRHTSAQPHIGLVLQAQICDRDSEEMCALLQQLLEYGMQLIKQPYTVLEGHLTISSTIPVGVGMGASAALCVAVAQWFSAQHWIKKQDQYAIARELEHMFHGQSSGLDIAGVSSSTGVYFQQGQTKPLSLTWSPQWRLSSCEQQGPTSDCIHKVQQLWKKHPTEAQRLDAQMQQSVDIAKHALEAPHPKKKHQIALAAAIHQAQDCFKHWGLITPALEEHMQALYQQGALAVKPTGSGGGGHVISLWESFDSQHETANLGPLY
ncbi:MAG: mevalonate kinase [Legionella sp.]|nr:MAG: mevalonate kinase [Legionella sp.]